MCIDVKYLSALVTLETGDRAKASKVRCLSLLFNIDFVDLFSACFFSLFCHIFDAIYLANSVQVCCRRRRAIASACRKATYHTTTRSHARDNVATRQHNKVRTTKISAIVLAHFVYDFTMSARLWLHQASRANANSCQRCHSCVQQMHNTSCCMPRPKSINEIT